MLNERDTKFLLNLKSQGYSKDEAVKALNFVKSKGGQGGQWSKATADISVGEDSKPITSVDKAGSAIGGAISKVGDVTNDVLQSKPAQAIKEGLFVAPNVAIGAGKGLATSVMNEVENQGINVPNKLQSLAEPSGIVQTGVAKATEGLSDLQLGVVKGLGSTAVGTYDLLGGDVSPETKERFESTNIPQSVGKIAEQIAEFAIPATKISKIPALAEKGLKGVELLQKYPKLAKIVPALAEILGDVTAQTAISAGQQGELTGGNVAMSVAGSVVPPVFGKVASKLGKTGEKMYEMAFKADKSLEKKNIERYGKSIGETARTELGYTGSASDIVEQAKKGQQAAKNAREEIAMNTDKVYRAEDFESLAEKISSAMTKNLPPSKIKTATQEAVNEMVMQYAPTKSKKFFTTSEMLGIIDDINGKQFSGKYALTDNQLTGFEQSLKSEIKSTMPKEISELYKESAINNTIRKVMSNNVVKKLVARTGYGLGTGAIIGASSAGGIDDPVRFIKNMLIGSIGGAIIGNTTASTKFLTKTGKALQDINPAKLEAITKSAIYTLRAIVNDYED